MKRKLAPKRRTCSKKKLHSVALGTSDLPVHLTVQGSKIDALELPTLYFEKPTTSETSESHERR